MYRLLLLVFLLVAAGPGQRAAAQADAGLPPRPTPFRFVTDAAGLLEPADAKKLESGLRRYADNTNTQIVVVTVPTLGGRSVADYGRALGTAWGVGQRDKNNGMVVLLSRQERQVTIQPGNGLAGVITPAVTSRAIAEMTPGFKQGNYFAGLRAGLNTLMATANPGSATSQPAAAAASGAASPAPAAEAGRLPADNQMELPAPPDPYASAPVAEPASPGLGLGALAIGALVIGGVLWLVVKMFRSRSAAAGNQRATPNFYPSQGSAPEFLPNRNAGPGYSNGPGQGSSGPGIGGMLATGAAAAAGAYLGNRMASGHEASGNSMNVNNNPGYGAGAAGAGAGAFGTGAADDYFGGRGGSSSPNTGYDYFSDANTAPDNSSDYFSADDTNSSYDDTSSDDTGGGGFDSTTDNSGSW